MSNAFAFDLGDWFSDKATEIQKNLKRSFGGERGSRFTGCWFEPFASASSADQFESTDILAVKALSVAVPIESAAQLIVTEADRFNMMLTKIPKDVDLWQVARSEVEPQSSAAELHAALKSLDGVGYVTAGKLLAAKRPRLIPILDSKVEQLLKPPPNRFWVTMHDQLSNGARRRRSPKCVPVRPATSACCGGSMWRSGCTQPTGHGLGNDDPRVAALRGTQVEWIAATDSH
ncbi:MULTISPECIES: DUF6308 family protein [unclassified Mycobacterium]|uniref:DUF6308 family protein n=1 Tax=unclassified Mycobacterium TaxID=2642494 RepID=UPI000AD5DDE9|nr:MULTISPECIES: DUF6308 family protein [unclassified Mycobacterium]